MEAPKFKIPGRERGRSPNDAPNTVKDMAWASQKPESLFDFFRGRFLMLIGMVAILAFGFSMMNHTAARPDYRRSARSAQTQTDPAEGEPVVIVDPRDGITKAAKDGETHPVKAPAAEEPPLDEAPPEDPKPGAEVKAEQPNFKRTIYNGKEALVREFREPLDQFEPLEKLDYKDDLFQEIYELVMDDDLDTPGGRANARNYGYAAEIIYMYYRFLRTHEKDPEKIEEYYKKRKEELRAQFGKESLSEATFRNVMPYPREEQSTRRPNYQEYRGQLLHFTGLLMQKCELREWNDPENNSGIRDTWLLVCRDLKRRDELYGVLVPHSARHLLSRDEVDNANIVRWDGLFLQRWTYENKSEGYGRMPLYVAWKVERLEQPPADRGINWLLVAVGVIVSSGLIFVLWQVGKDNKQAGAYRRTFRRKPAGAEKAIPAGASTAPAGEAQAAPTSDQTPAPPPPPTAPPPDTASDPASESPPQD